MSLFSKFFSHQKNLTYGTAETEADRLIAYVVSFINRRDFASNQLDKYKEAKKLPAEEREIAYISLYFDLEKFIINNKLPIIKQDFDKEGLRISVKQNVNLFEVNEYLSLIFLPDIKQSFYIFELGVREMVKFLVRNGKIERITNLIADALKNTVLNSIAVKGTGLDLSKTYQSINQIDPGNLILSFGLLYKILYKEIGDSFGKSTASDFIIKFYQFLKKYDYDIVTKFLDVAPEGSIPANEKLSFLSRQELEKKIIAATETERLKREEAQKRAKELEQALNELSQSKSAITNLLEEERGLDQKLQAESHRLKAIISSMDEGMIVVDRELRVVLINPAAEKIFEVTKDVVIGKKIDEFYSVYKKNNALPLEEWPAIKALKTGKTITTDSEDNLYYKNLSDKKIPVAISASPLHGDGITGVVIVFRDITKEKKLDETRASFISTVSHQLRTPLTAIRWYVEMLDAGDAGLLNENQKQFVNQIYNSVLRLNETLNIFLTLSRIESGRLKTETTKIDLLKITNELLKDLDPFILEKKLDVKIICDSDKSMEVNLDANLLRQVITNFLSNSTRYSNENGNIEIEIKKTSSEITYSIKDNGIGIPENQKDRIFEKFFRSTNAINKAPNGNGLGLALVKKLVEFWKGKVWFESPVIWEYQGTEKKARGTIFYFTIPMI